MTTPTLAQRRQALPLVIAGPIVRKVTSRQVNVWFVLKESRKIFVQVFDYVNGSPVSKGMGSADTHQIGDYLHIALVTIDFASSLTTGKKYHYNAYFLQAGQTAPTTNLANNVQNYDDLWSPGIIYEATHTSGQDDDQKLTYWGDAYPSFKVPPRDPHFLSFAHGSCRKPHGGYDYSDDEQENRNQDALYLLDQAIAGQRSGLSYDFMDSPGDEPYFLCLTGDQIYADDVHPRMLYIIRTLVPLLFNEDFLQSKEASFGSQSGWNAQDFGVNRRASMMLDRAEFTCGFGDYGHNQLIHTAEFYIMYLLAWSDNLWPEEEEIKAIDIPSGTPGYLSGIDHEKLASIISFRRTVSNARRLLANVSTYMMFDDHEITDDWFLNLNITRDTLNSPLGSYIIANGMSAYALFQGWGNKPDYFSPSGSGDGSTLMSKLLSWYDVDIKNKSSFSLNPTTHEIGISDQILPTLVGSNDEYGSGLDGWRLITSIDWFFNIDFGEYLLVVMDPRTNRWFREESRAKIQGEELDYPGHDPAGLISESSLPDQIPNPPSGNKLTLLVSPAPVVGLASTEAVQVNGLSGYKYLKPDARGIILQNSLWNSGSARESGFSKFDAEAWSFNEYAWDALIARLVPHENVIILSGDVHYGFTVRMDVYDASSLANPLIAQVAQDHDEDPGPAGIRHLKIMQCTASSLKNETTATTMTNANIWMDFKGKGFRAALTDQRDTQRQSRGLFGNSPADIPDELIGGKNPHFQLFYKPLSGNSDKLGDYYYNTYPPRIFNFKYFRDNRKPGERAHDSARFSPGRNNFGLVQIDWKSGNHNVKHIMPFRDVWTHPTAHCQHEMDFDNSVHDNTPYVAP